MNKHDKLLVIDPKLLISGGSSIHSNDFNPDEEDVWIVFPSCSNVGISHNNLISIMKQEQIFFTTLHKVELGEYIGSSISSDITPTEEREL